MEIKVTTTPNLTDEQLEKIKQEILADEEATTMCMLPLFYNLDDVYDIKQISGLFYSSMVVNLKQDKAQYNKLKKELEAKLDEKYLSKVVGIYNEILNRAENKVLYVVIEALYEISIIKDSKLQEKKLRQFNLFLEDTDNDIDNKTSKKELIKDILFMVENTGYFIDYNHYVAQLKGCVNDYLGLTFIATEITNFSVYLLSDDNTLYVKYKPFKDAQKTDILGNIYTQENTYTNYNLLTDDGKKNYESKHKTINEKFTILKKHLKNERKQNLDEPPRKKTYTDFNDFINLVAFTDEERDILAKKEKEEIAELETLRPKNSNTSYIFNDKLSNEISNIENNTPTLIVKTTGKELPQDKELKVLISNAEITYKKPINDFDMAILETLQAIFIDGNFTFDILMVKEKVAHINTKYAQARGDTLENDIKESIEKMRNTDMTLDISQEINKTFKIKLADEKIKEFSETGKILPLNIIKVNKGGTIKEAYRFTSKPMYFTYAEARGQILTYSTNILALPKNVAKSKENIILARAILKRVLDLKSVPTKNNKDKKRKYDLYPNLSIIVIDNLLEETSVLPKEYVYNENLSDEENEAEKQKYNTNYRKRKARYIDTIKDLLYELRTTDTIKTYEIYDQKNQKVDPTQKGVSVRAIKIILGK